MALYTTLHLHNVPAGREEDYARWFDGPHRTALESMRGFRGADRFEVAAEQIMPDVPQCWRYLSIYDVETDTPEIDVPALAPLIAAGRDDGLIVTDETERLFSYRLYSDWVEGENLRRDAPFSGVFVLFGNYVPGRYQEYMDWYDHTHCPEVIAVPGMVAMRRGALAAQQLEPRTYCPGDQLVMCAQQTDDLSFTIKDFAMRALGKSPSGIAMAPRSSSGSIARTIHFFRRISGTDRWSGGIAYAGDMSVYSDA